MTKEKLIKGKELEFFTDIILDSDFSLEKDNEGKYLIVDKTLNQIRASYEDKPTPSMIIEEIETYTVSPLLDDLTELGEIYGFSCKELPNTCYEWEEVLEKPEFQDFINIYEYEIAMAVLIADSYLDKIIDVDAVIEEIAKREKYLDETIDIDAIIEEFAEREKLND